MAGSIAAKSMSRHIFRRFGLKYGITGIDFP